MSPAPEPSSTPWYKIYLFILLFNAILIILFYVMRMYFNID